MIDIQCRYILYLCDRLSDVEHTSKHCEYLIIQKYQACK